MNNTQNKKEVLLQVGEKCVVEFVDVSYEGLGVCKVDAIDLKGNFYQNYPIFVEGALYDEKGIVEITKLNKTFANAKLVKLFTDKTSKYRQQPTCPHYEECGGCDIMHLNFISVMDRCVHSNYIFNFYLRHQSNTFKSIFNNLSFKN